MKFQARGLQLYLKRLRNRRFSKNFPNLEKQLGCLGRLLLISFFNNLYDGNTHRDEKDTEQLSPSLITATASVYFCVSFFDNLNEEDRELLDESDHEFSCSDEDSETEYY